MPNIATNPTIAYTKFYSLCHRHFSLFGMCLLNIVMDWVFAERGQSECAFKVARSDFWVTIPLNFERLEHHHYQSSHFLAYRVDASSPRVSGELLCPKRYQESRHKHNMLQYDRVLQLAQFSPATFGQRSVRTPCYYISASWKSIDKYFISIYTLSDLGVLSNLIGSLSLANC